MKKIVLLTITLILFSVPCLAQPEVEGLFGVNNTLWETRFIPFCPYCVFHIGFSENKVFISTPQTSPTFYESSASMVINLGVVCLYLFNPGTEESNWQAGSVIPFLGVGIHYTQLIGPIIIPSIIKKIDDNWTPP